MTKVTEISMSAMNPLCTSLSPMGRGAAPGISSEAKINNSFIINIYRTLGVRGPDTLWRVPWTPLLDAFLSLFVVDNIKGEQNGVCN